MVACIPNRRSVGPLIGKLLLDGIKQRAVHDRWLLAGQDLVLVFDFTDVEAIAKQIEQRDTAEEDAATDRTGCKQSLLGSEVALPEVSHQCIDAAEFEKAPVDQ